MGTRLITKGKVVLVPFPFDDLSSSKLRPAVCLTGPIGQHRHVVVAFITSRVKSDLTEAAVLIDSSDSLFAMTGLKVSSIIKLHRLMAISSPVIRRELGEPSPKMLTELGAKLKKLFALS